MRRNFCFVMMLVASVAVMAADHVMQATHHVEQTGALETMSFSVSEAQEYAVRQNRTLRNASLDVQVAYAQRWQTIASMLPSLDGSFNYTNYCNYSAEMSFGGQPMKIAMPNYSALGLQTAVGINAQGVIGAVMQTQAIAIKKLQYEQNELELRSNVWQSYAAILALESMTDLLDSSLVNLRRMADMTRQSVAVGMAEQTTVDQISIRVNTLENNVRAQKRAIDLALNGLKILLDVPAETELILTTNLDDLLSAERVLGLLGEHFNIHNNLNYQLLEKNVKVAKLGVHSAGWAYGPTLSVAHVYNQQKYYADGGMRMTPPNLVQIGVSLPLWSSGKRAAGVVEKKIAYEQARNSFSTTTNQLYIQNQQLRNALTNDYETYLTEKENIDVTRRVFASTSNKFYYGTASNLDLTNASNDLIQAQSTYIQAVLALVQAEMDLVVFLNNK